MSTQNTQTQARISKGVTTGGQYATMPKGESEVSLEQAFGPRDVDMSPEEMMIVAHRAANRHARLQGLQFTDKEDIRQDTIEAVLRQRQKNPGRVVTPALINRVSSGYAAIEARGMLSPNDRKAIGIYQSKLDQAQIDLGRALTPKERDDLAAQIRENWHDNRHRPSVDFVARASRGVTVSLDAPSGEGTTAFMDVIADRFEHQDQDHLAIDPDSATATALNLAANRQKAEAKESLWTVFTSQRPDLPQPLEGTLNRREGIAHLKVLKDLAKDGTDPVRQGINDWNAGRDDSAACRAVFAPFGPLDADGKDAVADLFTEHRPYALKVHRHLMDRAMAPALERAKRTGKTG